MSVAHPLPADARRSLLIYNLLFPFVFLALLPGLLRRMLRRGHFRAKFGQRLGQADVVAFEVIDRQAQELTQLGFAGQNGVGGLHAGRRGPGGRSVHSAGGG